jgi:DNA-binding transcriptional LysR family regulator
VLFWAPLLIKRAGRQMLTLKQLKTFRAVAGTSNFSRAATELGSSQSNVTWNIQALERELGVLLFQQRYRFSRHVVLTDAGRRALEYTEKLLALVEETKAAVRNESEPLADLNASHTSAT